MSKLSWLRWAILTGGLALLSACELSGPQSTLEPMGPVAEKQISLLIYTMWLSVIVLVGVGGALLFAMVRYRQKANDESIPPQTHGNALVEISLILLATVIVILVAIPTIRVNFQTGIAVEPTEDDIVINVTGYQWWWDFEYPDLGIVTANELHIPKGKRVIFNLASADVLHSFWVPKLAGKRDLIPNQNNQLWFTTDENTDLGVYFGQCAELCLGAHAYMRFRIVVDSEEDFEAWVSSFQSIEPLSAEAPSQDLTLVHDPLVERGQQLFLQKGCAACHAIKGFVGGAPDKPNLTNFGLRTSVGAGILDNTPENLARWLRDPQEVKPGNYMPTLWQSDDPNREEEIEAITAYLLSLGTPHQEPQAHAGGKLWQ